MWSEGQKVIQNTYTYLETPNIVKKSKIVEHLNINISKNLKIKHNKSKYP